VGPGRLAAVADENAVVALADRLVERVLGVGIAGAGPFAGAAETAEQQLDAAGGDREDAIRRLVAAHVRLAATSGFVTGLGGVATLPVSVPASMAGFAVVAARMAAGIAHLRGYDLDEPAVRSAVLVALLAGGAPAVLAEVGVDPDERPVTAALGRLPAGVLAELDRRVGHRLVARAGEKGAVGLAKLVPLVGGPLGAAVDGVSAKAIAGHALRTFVPAAPRVVRATIEVLPSAGEASTPAAGDAPRRGETG
jgi:hypothetical protein